jgi:hypothetical protein
MVFPDHPALFFIVSDESIMATPDREKSYNQLMNEWAAQRTFVRRMRSRIFHPPYDASIVGKILGYLWRLVVVVVAGLAVNLYLLSHHIGSEGFRRQMADEAAKYLHGTNVKVGQTSMPLTSFGKLNWSQVSAEGTPESFFRRMEAFDISWNLGLGVLKKNWEMDELYAQSVRIQLRSGSSGAASESEKGDKAAPEDSRIVVPEFKTGRVNPPARMLTAGWGVNPDFSSLKIRAFRTPNCTLIWGFSPTNTGAVIDSNARVEKSGDGAWNLTLTGGKFTQNWLRNLEVEGISASITPDLITLSRAQFTHPGGGRLAMDGKVSLGDSPEFDIRVAMADVPLTQLIPAPFNRYVTGLCKAEGVMNGTTNHASGVTMKLRCELTGTGIQVVEVRGKPTPEEQARAAKGLLHHFPVLSALYHASADDRLGQIPLTKGTFELTTGGGKAHITNILLQSENLATVQGEIMCEEAPKTSPDAGGSPMYKASGTLYLGLIPEIVGKMAANIQSEAFKIDQSGMRWMLIRFQDEDGHQFIKAVADAITSLHLQSLGRKVQ